MKKVQICKTFLEYEKCQDTCKLIVFKFFLQGSKYDFKITCRFISYIFFVAEMQYS